VIPEGTIPGLPGVSSAAPAAKHSGNPPINVSPHPGTQATIPCNPLRFSAVALIPGGCHSFWINSNEHIK